MVTPFKAYRIHEVDGKVSGRFENLTLDSLTPGEYKVTLLDAPFEATLRAEE